ncbi:fibrohexamerin-like [Helicoverpa armigera]|uniref:fibrohexamerin-like n=1 Tax=Helicoverpa armigera TaxID=29058 RepID=UPI003082FF72
MRTAMVANKSATYNYVQKDDLTIYHYTFTSSDDHHDPIVRPCSLHDVDCIRRFFAHNSKCSPVHKPGSDTYRIKTLPLFIAHVNVSFTLSYMELKGLNNYTINEFNINKETDALVLEVVFSKLQAYVPIILSTYHLKGKEPTQIADFGFIEYKDLSLTLTAENIKDMNLAKSHVYAYISEPAQRSSFSIKIVFVLDPQQQIANAQLLARIGLTLQEAFLTQAPVFMNVFLQNSICDSNIH